MNRLATFAVWFLSHFADTVNLASVAKGLHRELERRAEYAMRFGIHAPSQLDPRTFILPLIVALFLVSLFALR